MSLSLFQPPRQSRENFGESCSLSSSFLSKKNFQPELNLARIAGAEYASHCRRNRDVGERVPKVRMVGQIEELRAELHGHRLFDLRVFQHAQIDDDVTRRSEEHTSELQSLRHLVCRLLLEKKKKI